MEQLFSIKISRWLERLSEILDVGKDSKFRIAEKVLVSKIGLLQSRPVISRCDQTIYSELGRYQRNRCLSNAFSFSLIVL